MTLSCGGYGGHVTHLALLRQCDLHYTSLYTLYSTQKHKHLDINQLVVIGLCPEGVYCFSIPYQGK